MMAAYDTVTFGGLKKVLRKIAAPVAAGAAIAVGQPQLAAPAYAAAKGATKKNPKLAPPVEPLPPSSFLDTLSPGDKSVLTIGGAVVGTLLLVRLLSPPRRR